MPDVDEKGKKKNEKTQNDGSGVVQNEIDEGLLAKANESSADSLSCNSRRRFLQYTLAGSTTLIVGGIWFECKESEASIATPEFGEILDVADVIKLAESPYAENFVLEVTENNRIRLELPRLEMGQGITTAVAVLIAEELDADYERVDVVLSDRREDRPFSLTGSSSSIRSLWDPIRKVAALARARLLTAAATRWDLQPELLSTTDSRVHGAGELVATYGELSADAAKVVHPLISLSPKPLSQYKHIGVARQRKDAHDIVTGRQVYTLDTQVPGAMPAVVAHSPDIGGAPIDWDDTQARSIMKSLAGLSWG
jgi:isoquinoline 1-oxidoreductase beta subunit